MEVPVLGKHSGVVDQQVEPCITNHSVNLEQVFLIGSKKEDKGSIAFLDFVMVKYHLQLSLLPVSQLRDNSQCWSLRAAKRVGKKFYRPVPKALLQTN